MSTPPDRGPAVRIVRLSPAALAALALRDLAAANAASPVPLTPWFISDDCHDVWRMRARQVVDRPADLPWITGVLWDDHAQVAVGQSGFHGAPDEAGMVEVGYAVDPAHRRRGYARAALEQAIARARTEPSVHVLRATISPDNDASLALIAQYPFVRNGEQWDDEDGLELIFELVF